MKLSVEKTTLISSAGYIRQAIHKLMNFLNCWVCGQLKICGFSKILLSDHIPP